MRQEYEQKMRKTDMRRTQILKRASTYQGSLPTCKHVSTVTIGWSTLPQQRRVRIFGFSKHDFSEN